MSIRENKNRTFCDQWTSWRVEGLTAAQAADRAGVGRRSLLKMRVRVERDMGISLPPLGESKGGQMKGSAKDRNDTLHITQPPSPIAPIEDIIDRRRKEFSRKKQHAEGSKSIRVEVPIEGPIGILHFGDPHIDNPGCDIDLLLKHRDIVRNTPGMYGANIGDLTDNWVGRLGRLYEHHTTTREESWVLAEHFLKSVPWLYLIGGNHDAWSGTESPIPWILRSCSGVFQWHECRLKLVFPKGEPVTIYARHDWPGKSIHNPAHGSMRGARKFRDDIHISGHRHHSGYGIVAQNDGSISHAILLGAYKIIDDYAAEKGFQDEQVSPCAVTIIDPEAPAVDRVKVYWDPIYAAEALTALRSKAGGK